MTATLSLPTRAELVAQRQNLERQVAATRARLGAIAPERSAARRAGDAAAVLRLEVEQEDLQAAIDAFASELAGLVEPERLAGQRELAERLRRALAEARAFRRDRTWPAVEAALDALAVAAGQDHRAVQAVAEVEATLSPLTDKMEARRQFLRRESYGAHVETAGRVLGEWLGADPAIPVDVALMQRVTGPAGDLARRLWARFSK